MLKIQNLQVAYGGIQALRGIDMEVPDGKIVTLIGANGAGKSTTMNTVAGLLKPKSGSITFEGHDITSTPASKVVSLGLALCPEGRRVFQQMSVRENLEMGGYTRPAGELATSLDQVFEQFPRLKERQRQIAGTLSGGEQQMLAMGRALMSKPKLLMLDEPSMGAAAGRADFRDSLEAQSGGHDDPAGRAECADGAFHRQPRLCAGNRPCRQGRQRRRAHARRHGAQGVSGINAYTKLRSPIGRAGLLLE